METKSKILGKNVNVPKSSYKDTTFSLTQFCSKNYRMFKKTTLNLLHKMPSSDGWPAYLCKKNVVFEFKCWFFGFNVVIKVQMYPSST